MPQDPRFAIPADALTDVRNACHAAVQWASLAARANLDAAPDDSHSNLGWDCAAGALMSHGLDPESRFQLGFSFTNAALIWRVDGTVGDSLPMVATAQSTAQAWVDAHLASAALAPAGAATLPYELSPPDYAALAKTNAVLALGDWFDAAHRALTHLAETAASTALRTAPVRCWPHHFDIATLATLSEGDPETARSIGTGLSPGDDSYYEPYFYCAPWPVPSALPDAPAPWHWHTDGFTSLVCPVSRLAAATPLNPLLGDAYSTVLGTLD